MPLIVMCGPPSSGKTTRCVQLKEFFQDVKNMNVHIVCENSIISASKQNKNDVFRDSAKEKAIRGQLKAEITRLLGKDDVIIVDSSNYIKGYRYELFCMAKATKTTQCTVLCIAPQEIAWEWNFKREKDEQYNKEVFNGLFLRFEEPDSMNRWDNPLFIATPEENLLLSDLGNVLFECMPPSPNNSTQCTPISSAGYLYEMDKITQEIILRILAAKKVNLEGTISIPGYEQKIFFKNGNKVTPVQLTRIRRQFISYSKLHPGSDVTKIGVLFIQHLNSHIQ